MTILHLFDHRILGLQYFAMSSLPLQPAHSPERQNDPRASHLTQTKTLDNSHGQR